MNYSIYIRPLKLDDAKISYKWRNNPAIWEYTKYTPTKNITKATETKWIKRVLKNKNEHRFAICLKENDKYLGNIQLIDVMNNSAEFHLFIGETSYWGKGFGKEATALIIDYGFTILGLTSIRLDVHTENFWAQNVYKKMGFMPKKENENYIEMVLTSIAYSGLQHSNISLNNYT